MAEEDDTTGPKLFFLSGGPLLLIDFMGVAILLGTELTEELDFRGAEAEVIGAEDLVIGGEDLVIGAEDGALGGGLLGPGEGGPFLLPKREVDMLKLILLVALRKAISLQP